MAFGPQKSPLGINRLRSFWERQLEAKIAKHLLVPNDEIAKLQPKHCKESLCGILRKVFFSELSQTALGQAGPLVAIIMQVG